MYAINYTSLSIRNISRGHGGFESSSWSQASLHNPCTYRFSAWRPLKHVVREAPLAFCDFTSVDPVDLIATDRPSREYVGEVYYMKYNSAQRWYWLSQQTPDELSLFMSYDSDPGEGEATCKAPEMHSRWNLTDRCNHLSSMPTFCIPISGWSASCRAARKLRDTADSHHEENSYFYHVMRPSLILATGSEGRRSSF